MKKASRYVILVIDDDDGFRDILMTSLGKEGFQMYGAKNGEEGISQAKEVRPNLIILDVEMPVLNGVETALRINGDSSLKGVKIVFITSYGDSKQELSWIDEKFAREMGAVDYIRKTENMERITAHIKKILRV